MALDFRYFRKTGTSVTVGELPPGRHDLRIYTVSSDRYGGQHEELVYQGKVKTFVGMVTNFTYDPYNGDIHEYEEEIHDHFNYNGQPTNEGIGTYEKNAYDNPSTQAPPPNGSEDNRYMQQQDSNVPAASPVAPESIGTVTEENMTRLKKKADAKNSDTEKMKALKEGLKGEKIMTDQVAILNPIQF